MQERESRNTFPEVLINGIIEAFTAIKENGNYKVVILTGYDNYFCCGGTKEELVKTYKKELAFNDLDFFMSPLKCEIPVISAMQGHGIGVGFVFDC